MDWARVLAYVTGTVDQELLARNEYLAAENRILKAQLKGRFKLSDAERATLGEIGHCLGRKALAELATVARPDTILAWYRKLVASKFDGSKGRCGPGRPRIRREVEQLIVRMAEENRDSGDIHPAAFKMDEKQHVMVANPRSVSTSAVKKSVPYGNAQTRKSSFFALPPLVAAASHRGMRPRPVHVFSGFFGSRYFTATLPLPPLPNSSSSSKPCALAMAIAF